MVEKKQKSKIKLEFAIAILSLIVSMVAIAISMNLHSPYAPEAYIDGVYFEPLSSQNPPSYPRDGLSFIVPVSFINKGNQGGIVEEIYLEVNYRGNITRLNAAYEIDPISLTKYGCITQESFIKPFSSFGLEGNQEKDKTFLFIPIVKNNEGGYRFSLIIKNKDLEIRKNIEMNLTEGKFKDGLNGTIYYLRTSEHYSKIVPLSSNCLQN